MERLYWRAVPSILGQVTVCCSDRGLREVRLGEERKAGRDGNGRGRLSLERANRKRGGEQGARWADEAARQLQEYLAGQRKEFTIPLDLRGTAFQRKVWKALLQISYGATRSYGEIARKIGHSRAARAVGGANHSNPVAIVVPCHRVIASDGSLGGYAGGVKRKSLLLRLEKARGR